MRETKRKLPTIPEFLLKEDTQAESPSTKWPKMLNQWQIGPEKGFILPHAWSKKSWGSTFKLLKLGK